MTKIGNFMTEFQIWLPCDHTNKLFYFMAILSNLPFCMTKQQIQDVFSLNKILDFGHFADEKK